MADGLGDRMKKNYEDRYRFFLTRRTPVIIRLDGKAFHTLTRGFEKPFDRGFCGCMDCVALKLCEEVQGAKCAYVQSDEISILLTDFEKLTTDAWFDYNVQKIASVSAGMASAILTNLMGGDVVAVFDSRAFNVPREDVCNYFIWRQKDWVRNSVQMLAQAHFSHKELHGKKQVDMHDMLHSKNVNWSDLNPRYKNGKFIYKDMGYISSSIDVVFTDNRGLINRYLAGEDDYD